MVHVKNKQIEEIRCYCFKILPWPPVPHEVLETQHLTHHFCVSYSVSLAVVCSVSINFLSFPQVRGVSSCLRTLEPASCSWWHVFH